MAEIEVLATDGKVQKRILWIQVTPKGNYTGSFELSAKGDHISYHVDGNVVWTRGGKKIKTATFHSLKNFSGSSQICAYGFASDIDLLDVHNYEFKEVGDVVYIDARKYRLQKCDFGCIVALLEPNKFNFLYDLTKPSVDEIHIFTEFSPWIVIAVYQVTTDRFG